MKSSPNEFLRRLNPNNNPLAGAIMLLASLAAAGTVITLLGPEQSPSQDQCKDLEYLNIPYNVNPNLHNALEAMKYGCRSKALEAIDAGTYNSTDAENDDFGSSLEQEE